MDYPEGFSITDTNTVDVQVSGNDHAVSINGEVVITYPDDSDTAYSSGFIGLRMWGNSRDTKLS